MNHRIYREPVNVRRPKTGIHLKPSEAGSNGRGGAAERESFPAERGSELSGACDDER
jgi:hypothetical protein